MANWSKLQPALNFARQNLDKNLALAELASQTGQSLFHVHRTLRAGLRETPKQFTLRLRIDRAAAALVSSETSILDIALDCGFESHEAFCRAFRRRFGLTPSAYRRRGLSGRTASTAGSHIHLVNEIGPCVGLYHVELGERRSQQSMEYKITKQELAAQPVLVVRRQVRRSEIAATIGTVLPKVFLHAQKRGLAIAGYPVTR
jgi:AraC-like DNA-binding protein